MFVRKQRGTAKRPLTPTRLHKAGRVTLYVGLVIIVLSVVLAWAAAGPPKYPGEGAQRAYLLLIGLALGVGGVLGGAFLMLSARAARKGGR